MTFASRPQPDIFSRYRTVVTPTLVQGGAGISIVPDQCEAFVDIRLVPGVAREVVEDSVQRVIDEVRKSRPKFHVAVEVVTYIPPTVIPEDSEIIRAVRDAVVDVRGTPPEVFVSGPANESYLLNEYGIPTLTLGPAGEGAHAVDEHMEVNSLYQAMEIYAQVGLALGRRQGGLL
jgi:acetylornithine deacetylase